MPLYQYENGTGEVLELVRPVADRDCAPPGFRRVTVPQHLALFGTSNDRKEESSAEAAVPRALKQLDGNTVNAMVRQSGFSVAKFKEVWNL